MNIAEVYVQIRGNMQQLRSDLAQAKSGIVTWFNSLNGMLRTIGLGFGTYQIVRIGQQAIKDAIAQESINRRLAASLLSVGDNTRKAYQDVKSFSAEMQNLTMYSNEEVEQLAILGMGIGKMTAKQMPEMIKTAIGLAEVLGVDVNTAMNMLGRSMQGSFSLWSRYGLAMEKLTSDTERWAVITAAGARGWDIHMERVKSLEGELAQLKNVWRDFGKAVAESSTATFGPIVRDLTEVLDVMTKITELLGQAKREPGQARAEAIAQRVEKYAPPFMPGIKPSKAIQYGIKPMRYMYNLGRRMRPSLGEEPSTSISDRLAEQMLGDRPTGPPMGPVPVSAPAPPPPPFGMPASAFAGGLSDARIQEILTSLQSIDRKTPSMPPGMP